MPTVVYRSVVHQKWIHSIVIKTYLLDQFGNSQQIDRHQNKLNTKAERWHLRSEHVGGPGSQRWCFCPNWVSCTHTSRATYLIDHDREAQFSWSDYSSESKFRFANDNFIVLHIKSSDGTLLHFVMDLCLCDKSDIVTSQKSPFRKEIALPHQMILSSTETLMWRYLYSIIQ